MMMAKQGAPTAVPRLRFPEFQKTNAWEKRPFSRLFTVGNGRDYKHLGSGLIPVYGSGGYMLSVNDYLYDGESVCIGWKGTINNPIFLSGKFWTVDTLFYTHSFRDCLPLFIYLHFQNIDWLKHNEAGGVPSLSKSNIEKIEVSIPGLTEQQKVADCLTSLDEVIAAQGRKVEALKTHKRGLMQQLFPREGETRPRLRFPEFRNAPEWITRSLGELMVIGSSRRVHESDWTTAGVPFYRAREIVAIGKDEPINPLFISEALYREFAGYTGEIEEGQLLVTGVGSIGIPYLVKFGDRFYFKDGNIIWLKNNQADLAGNFLLRLFESGYVQGQIATMAGIGTVGTYTIENAKRTIAVFPVDKREQQRIAKCLSSLDTQITAEANQLAALKTHKQGLMQQLFPSPESAAI